MSSLPVPVSLDSTLRHLGSADPRRPFLIAPASRSDRWNTPGATPTARSMPSPSRSPRMPAAVSACCSTTATATSA